MIELTTTCTCPIVIDNFCWGVFYGVVISAISYILVEYIFIKH